MEGLKSRPRRSYSGTPMRHEHTYATRHGGRRTGSGSESRMGPWKTQAFTFPVRMKLLLTGVALVVAVTLSAQQPTPERLAVLRSELEAMHETDQAQRQEMTRVGNEQGQNSPEMTALWAKQTASDLHN